MSKEHIDHRQIQNFADSYVNLKREDAAKYREQVARLRKDLDNKLESDSDFQLKKMLLSGSLAKGTALKNLNDIDVAIYVLQDNPPADMPKFLRELVNILRNLYANMDPSQIVQQDHSVRISFKGTGLDVDIVPIAYDGNEKWDGHLFSTNKNSWLLTNIRKHINFIKERKMNNPDDFTQVARLLKFWIKEVKKRDANFRFKSFMLELILAHLSDRKRINYDNYIDAMADFLNFIVKGGLNEMIVFNDYYSSSQAEHDGRPICIYDPVNIENNVAEDYSLADKEHILHVAGEAADAIDAALYAPTKSETIRYWQKVFGSSFGG